MLHITFGHKPRSLTLEQHGRVSLVLKNSAYEELSTKEN
jgi:hypothetical protein